MKSETQCVGTFDRSHTKQANIVATIYGPQNISVEVAVKRGRIYCAIVTARKKEIRPEAQGYLTTCFIKHLLYMSGARINQNTVFALNYIFHSYAC